MTTPSFSSRDPSAPQFWDERFEQAFMPWDRGGVPVDLQAFVRAQAAQPLVTLIPGCGLGHEVKYLHAAGWDVTALDFSPAAVAAARRLLGPLGAHVIEADFFSFMPPRSVQLIYERAFLCSMPPRLWPQVVARWADLLPAGGLLAGYFFFDDSPKGPPFGIGAAQLETFMAPYFERRDDRTVTDSIAVFQDKERWQVWQRRAA
jgi:hypothetical protein